MARSLVLLVVAANRAHAETIRACVGRLSLSYDCRFVRGTRQALDFLQRMTPFEEAPRPDLILVVSRLSGNHAQDVLRSVKSNLSLCRIPVIVASGRGRLQDFGKTPDGRSRPVSENGARGLAVSLSLIENIDHFWART